MFHQQLCDTMHSDRELSYLANWAEMPKEAKDMAKVNLPNKGKADKIRCFGYGEHFLVPTHN